MSSWASSFRRASTYLPNPGRADLQSAVWNRRFGIYTAGFSTALAIIAFENCFRTFSIHIPNRRFQTADCRSALPGFGKYVDALFREGNTLSWQFIHTCNESDAVSLLDPVGGYFHLSL